jgi:hypothetical protein
VKPPPVAPRRSEEEAVTSPGSELRSELWYRCALDAFSSREAAKPTARPARATAHVIAASEILGVVQKPVAVAVAQIAAEPLRTVGRLLDIARRHLLG